ncbi:MAG: hypothetical protein ACI4FZ_04255 [Lachnospiraceae bacterium]
MKRLKLLSLLLAFVLVANFFIVPASYGNSYAVATCEENPCDFVAIDD